jgi:hypothetical protein
MNQRKFENRKLKPGACRHMICPRSSPKIPVAVPARTSPSDLLTYRICLEVAGGMVALRGKVLQRNGLDGKEGIRLRGAQSATHRATLRQAPVKSSYCAFVKGTTESLPIRTSGESAKSLFALISSSDTGLASAFPALITTTGFLGSEAFTETTVAVPTALRRSPVS